MLADNFLLIETDGVPVHGRLSNRRRGRRPVPAAPKLDVFALPQGRQNDVKHRTKVRVHHVAILL